MPYDRVWFLTWHTYGTWLPGSEKGFVSPIRNEHGEPGIHHISGTTIDADSPHLAEWSKRRLKSKPIILTRDQAGVLADQLIETAAYRNWTLFALAVVANHVHAVLGVAGDPESRELIADFKSYGSRALNKSFARPASGTWWTESGSMRKLDHESAILGAIRYTIDQQGALVVWTTAIPELNLMSGFLTR